MNLLRSFAAIVCALFCAAGPLRAQSNVGESAAFVFDTRDYLAGLAAESAGFSFDTRVVDGLGGSNQSGTFAFDTRTLSLMTIAVSGASSVPSGGTALYIATAQYVGTSNEDVSDRVVWSASGGPPGTQMIGRRLQAGIGPASTAQVQASLVRDNGGRTSSGLNVAIGAGLGVTINTPSVNYLAGTGSPIAYHLIAGAAVTGASGATTVTWALNGAPLSGQTTLTLDRSVSAAPGPATLAITVTDGAGKTGNARVQLHLNKAPNANEQHPPVSGANIQPATLFAADGAGGFAFEPDPGSARKERGLVVIIHGLDSKAESGGWMAQMAEQIQASLATTGAPNIMLYDWRDDAAPYGNGTDAIKDGMRELGLTAPPGSTLRKDLLTLVSESVDGVLRLPGGATLTLAEAIAVRGRGDAHGLALAGYLKTQIDAGKINPAKPIHFIGHSAGGFVAATCAAELLRQRHPAQLQVTTLDTPFLTPQHVVLVKNRGGKIERYISSILGVMVPALAFVNDWTDVERSLGSRSLAGPIFAFRPPPSPAQIASTPIVAPDVSYHVSADTEATGSVDHLHVYEWYIHTIQNPTQYHDGFYYSPLLGNSWSSGGGGGAALQAGVGFAPTLQLQSANKAGGGAIPASLAVTGFSTFGNVGASNDVYTLTEQGNAGIYQTLTIPMNATVLKFRVQFTQAGDGGFVGVYFGDFLPLALIGDGEVMRDEPVDFEIPVSQFGGETAQLLFKLSGVGADNAVVRIDGITIETDDDADHDGLTFAQETALGTDPRYFDTDGDGLSDAYEVNVSHTNPVLADSDGDGQSDAAEITVGTNPMDSHSVFAVTEFARAGGGFLLRWSAVAGKTYRILRSGTVDFASFDVIAVDVAGVTPVTTYNDTTISTVTTAQAFYRIEAE